MITSALIFIASTIVTLILAVFPASTGLPAEYDTALATFSGYVGILDPLVPIATLVDAVTIVLLYEITIFTFKGIAWTYHKIPLIGK